jgi:hypothetical protein
MKKKFFEGFNKIKQKFENIKDNIQTNIVSPEEMKNKEIKNKIDFIINEFSLQNIKSQHYMESDTMREVDCYYRPNDDTENPIVLVAVIGFHHKKGSIVEFFHPSKEEIFKNHQNFFDPKNLPKDSKKFDRDLIFDDILNQLTYFCLPDAVHTTNEDSQFFFIQNYQTILYGISCYRQIKTNSLEVDDQNTRDCVQKAMCIVSKVPLFAHFHSKLSSTMTAFFNQNTLKDKIILEELYANYESISFKNLNINEIFMSFSLRKLFMFCKEKIFAILKLILLEKKIIVYSHKSNNVCSFILSIISLIPGNILFNLNLGSSVKNFNVRIFLNCLEIFICIWTPASNS